MGKRNERLKWTRQSNVNLVADSNKWMDTMMEMLLDNEKIPNDKKNALMMGRLL
jgi:hypothetical protein